MHHVVLVGFAALGALLFYICIKFLCRKVDAYRQKTTKAYTRIEPIPGPTPWDKKPQPPASEKQPELVKKYVFPYTTPLPIVRDGEDGNAFDDVFKKFNHRWHKRQATDRDGWKWVPVPVDKLAEVEQAAERFYGQKAPTQLVDVPTKEYVFPETAPPEGYQKGTSYLVARKQFDGLWCARQQIHSGVWRWNFDEQYQNAWVDLQQKADLWNALSTRLLTQDELEKARAYGLSLSTDDLPRYVCDEGFDCNVYPRFQEGSVVDAWNLQETFQRIAKLHEPEDVPLNTV